jgi:Uma2 family endonuclease
MQTETTKKLFTVEEYYRMADAGILAQDARTELVGGEVIQMSPMGSSHAWAITRATHLFIESLREKAQVRVQLPLRIDSFSELEPDLCLVNPALNYERRHPGPADVFLVMEIAVASLSYDRDIKLPIYAAAQIPEVWIADLVNESLFVFRVPSDKDYKTFLAFERSGSVSPLAFPEVVFDVFSLLGKNKAQP